MLPDKLGLRLFYRRDLVKRLTLFVKGNVDVRDSLHSCRVAGDLRWNGINEVLRERYHGNLARIKHETWTRSDALLHCDGTVPEALERRDLSLGAYPIASQFSDAIFRTSADAIILSIQPDVTMSLMRHRRDGFLFYPSNVEKWTADDRAWLRSDCEARGLLSVDAAMNNLALIIAKIRERSGAPILIYNLSPIIPGDQIYCYMGVGETFSIRIRKFNLALASLSEETGISIIDVESIIARHGADALKLDAVHLTPMGYPFLAEEVARVLNDLGVLETT
jgi:hypothetical protein